ncbi:TauD/TfdA family dioxygenase [Pseudomonas citronellolis]|uniref:TauD/TfdA family dioxygenase n=1 Tax=Pseudomonas citronellolis TaxID=53408 RepID=UPI0023E3A668|nr:TauD/TfdA family dioxygenase [Pseudomonas citronellolis]MDF3933462.1 TauD/TfdA family dioxygenase [Pseudomonas citronellolis]
MSQVVDISSWASVVERFANCSNPYHEFERTAILAEQAVASLDYRQIFPLLEFKRQGAPGGRLLLRGATPDPDLMPTTELTSEIERHKRTFFSEFYLVMLGKLLGEPFSYTQERNGAVIHNVRPSRRNETNISSDSSAIILDLHNENIYHPVPPDYLLLSGLRRDPSGQAKTLVLGVDEVLSLLSKDEISTLSEFNFRTSVDYNFGNHDASRGDGPLIRVLFGDLASPMIAYDDEYIVGVNTRAQAALDRLRVILHEHMVEVDLAPGEILLLDNLKTVHGRTAFNARYDGTDRWLQRLLVSRDLRRAEMLLGETTRTISWAYENRSFYGYVDYR